MILPRSAGRAQGKGLPHLGLQSPPGQPPHQTQSTQHGDWWAPHTEITTNTPARREEQGHLRRSTVRPGAQARSRFTWLWAFLLAQPTEGPAGSLITLFHTTMTMGKTPPPQEDSWGERVTVERVGSSSCSWKRGCTFPESETISGAVAPSLPPYLACDLPVESPNATWNKWVNKVWSFLLKMGFISSNSMS